jgi:hypothetical protein
MMEKKIDFHELMKEFGSTVDLPAVDFHKQNLFLLFEIVMKNGSKVIKIQLDL